MHHENTRTGFGKRINDWNTRYDLDEFIRAHGLQPRAARELFEKFGPYKTDLESKIAELRANGKIDRNH
jgi:hypothetical protein